MKPVVFIRLLVLSVCLVVSSSRAGAEDRIVAPDTERVSAFHDMAFGMFICWSFSTFSGHEWTPGVEDVRFFNPTGFDPDQWCKVATGAGMNYILFLTKHHDGFCLWDTDTTDRNVTNTSALKGIDVLAEVKKACDRHGLKLALYFSEGDWSWSPENKGIHQSAALPDSKKAQLKELLTRYGPIEFIWFDRAVGDGGLSHADTSAFVKRLQPNCLVGYNSGSQDGANLRIGERGKASPLDEVDVAAIGSEKRARFMKGHDGYLAAEFTYPILEGQGRKDFRGAQWFYSLPENDHYAATPEKIYSDYREAKQHRNIFSLDVGPDRNGRIRDIDVKTLTQVGRYVRGEINLPPPPPTPIQGGQVTASSVWSLHPDYSPEKAADGDLHTRWGGQENSQSGWLQIDLGKEYTVVRAWADEAGYDRIKRFEIQVKRGEIWTPVAKGRTCGDSKRIPFPEPVTGQVFRFCILEAGGVPTVSEFQLFE